jgi:hypothetical protein
MNRVAGARRRPPHDWFKMQMGAYVISDTLTAELWRPPWYRLLRHGQWRPISASVSVLGVEGPLRERDRGFAFQVP